MESPDRQSDALIAHASAEREVRDYSADVTSKRVRKWANLVHLEGASETSSLVALWSDSAIGVDITDGLG